MVLVCRDKAGTMFNWNGGGACGCIFKGVAGWLAVYVAVCEAFTRAYEALGGGLPELCVHSSYNKRLNEMEP